MVRPDGLVLVTTPQRERWRYPYHAALGLISRDEDELMAEWGHVRRGYTEAELDGLFRGPSTRRSSFVNPLLAISHDVAFSRLGRVGRLALHAVGRADLVGRIPARRAGRSRDRDRRVLRQGAGRVNERGRVIVTGGAGYIGSHACKALAARGVRAGHL